jgi:hypothetical protein
VFLFLIFLGDLFLWEGESWTEQALRLAWLGTVALPTRIVLSVPRCLSEVGWMSERISNTNRHHRHSPPHFTWRGCLTRNPNYK